MSKPDFIHETFIRAPADAIWKGLTTPEFTRRYFHATAIESSWEIGAPVRFLNDDGSVAVEGEVLEIDPSCTLSITWHVLYDDQAAAEAASRVTFTIEPHGDMCRLRMVHDRFPENTIVRDNVAEGWPRILASLKSLLETGTALALPAA